MLAPPVQSEFGLHAAAAEQRPSVHDVMYLPAINTARGTRANLCQYGQDYVSVLLQPTPEDPRKYLVG